MQPLLLVGGWISDDHRQLCIPMSSLVRRAQHKSNATVYKSIPGSLQGAIFRVVRKPPTIKAALNDPSRPISGRYFLRKVFAGQSSRFNILPHVLDLALIPL